MRVYFLPMYNAKTAQMQSVNCLTVWVLSPRVFVYVSSSVGVRDCVCFWYTRLSNQIRWTSHTHTNCVQSFYIFIANKNFTLFSFHSLLLLVSIVCSYKKRKRSKRIGLCHVSILCGGDASKKGERTLKIHEILLNLTPYCAKRCINSFSMAFIFSDNELSSIAWNSYTVFSLAFISELKCSYTVTETTANKIKTNKTWNCTRKKRGKKQSPNTEEMYALRDFCLCRNGDSHTHIFTART